MAVPQVKSLDRADEVRAFPNGGDARVSLAGGTIARAELRPGWRWSNDVAPTAGTPTCQAHHVGYLIAGTLHIEADDGGQVEVVAGDAFEVPPGHDAWVVGDVPCRFVEWAAPAASA